LHLGVTRTLLQDPAAHHKTVNYGYDTARQGKIQA